MTRKELAVILNTALIKSEYADLFEHIAAFALVEKNGLITGLGIETTNGEKFDIQITRRN